MQRLSLKDMELVTQVQILDSSVCVSLCANALENAINPYARQTSNRKIEKKNLGF